MVKFGGTVKSQIGALLLGGAFAVSAAGGAFAADLGGGGYKDPLAAGNKFEWSGYLLGTTEYIFRGISQTRREPTVQGGVDLSYGIFYAGTFVSGLDFEDRTIPRGEFFQTRATREVDIYGGIKPKWGDATFDFGVIWYTYPAAKFRNNFTFDPEYVEFKAGISGTVLKDVNVAATVFYSPDYSFQLGNAVTLEGTVSKSVFKKGDVEIGLSGTIGAVFFEEDRLPPAGNLTSLNDYRYWNVGATLTLKERFSFDVRYHGTDLDEGKAPGGALAAGGGAPNVFQAGDTIVGTAKVTF
jgi:uncharacterized protein (TIGR02001 family)